MSNKQQDYDSVVRDLVAEYDEILGAVILYKQLPITDLIGILNKTETLKIADQLIEFHNSINRLPSQIGREHV
ncbi:hypothetical protein, partial [Moorena sp. SIO4G3]|uniref:hypothetical protein n=1 Tax=Moorena sp. SIO4G3 TaxID=2607821 RepID=UPI0025E9E636